MTETKDDKNDLFYGDNFHKRMVEAYEEEVLQFERFMRENVYDFHSPDGYGNSDMWHVWSSITNGYEDAKENWRKCRKELTEKQNWLIDRGMMPKREVIHGVPVIPCHKNIDKYVQWNYIVWDYASEKQLRKDIDWAKKTFTNFVSSRVNYWWSREEYRLSWKNGTPKLLRPIQADLVLSDGNYNSISLFTQGGDHFLELEYSGRDGQSGGFSYDDKYGIYEVIDRFYKDIFSWIKSLERDK